jgi:uncharacterized protein YcnI
MKKLLKKWGITLVSSCAALTIFASTASGHVTVNPGVSAPGAWETYTMKVPVEKNFNTTKVALKVPDGVELMSYQPVTGWKTTLDKDASGKTKTITWTASGEGIAPGQFQQFDFVAKNPEKETNAAWDAFQYYKDGSVVEWTGDEGSDAPHSITNITTTSANANDKEGHSTDKATNGDKAEETKTANKSETAQTTVLTLSIIALILSIIAIIFAFTRRK